MSDTCPWEQYPLHELDEKGVVTLGRGNIISKIDIKNNPGGFPIYSSSAKGEGLFGAYGDYMFDEEMITWSVDGGGNLFYRPRHKFSVTNVSGYMRLDTSVLDYQFAHASLALQHSKLTFDYQTKAHPSVIRNLYNLPIPPLPEQKKIAEILSGIDNAIVKLKCKARKLDSLQFSLTEEFTQDLNGKGETSALEENAEIRTGLAKNSNNEGDMVEMPYMRVANVQDGYLDLGEIKTISIDRGRIKKYLLQKGDVLINEGGDLDKVGRGVIWHEEIKECLHQNHVFAVRCSERLMPEFLSLYLKSSHSKNYFLGCAKQTTNLASINSTQLKSFPIPVPELSVQEKFVKRITSTKDLSFAIATEISGLGAIKKAISADLLSGRKRVSI